MKHISNTQSNRMSQQSVRISTAMIGVLWLRLRNIDTWRSISKKTMETLNETIFFNLKNLRSCYACLVCFFQILSFTKVFK